MPLPARELGAARARRGLIGAGRRLAAAVLLVAVQSVASVAHAADRRLVVAFGAPGSEPMARFERLVDAARCRLVDRDVDVRLVHAAELEAFGPDPDAAVVEDAALARLARLRGPDAGPFELVLVGKDGGVKARADDPDALGAFLERIDAMPMRRAEMRRAGGADVACEGGLGPAHPDPDP